MSVTFTTAQVLGFLGAIITVSGAVSVIANMLTKIQGPEKLQNARLDNLEMKMKHHDDLFAKDLRRFEDLEQGNKVTQKALLGLLAHALDGNDIETIRRAKTDLEEYLIER